ncbi:MAG: hypothetical protein DME89_06730 [Verrucomicrobia bacterium]|nr:MAG: hypothetical protein DME89_06730 [Verrucomicrobiota bacterium]
MNWANRITLSRLALTVLFVIALDSSWQYARTTALVIFLIAGLTDFIDGEIARRYGLITNFGKLMELLSFLRFFQLRNCGMRAKHRLGGCEPGMKLAQSSCGLLWH